MADNPYDLITKTYDASINNINAQQQAQELATQQNQQNLYDQLTEQNRGLYTTYNNAINPFGSNAEQRGVMGTGVSDYLKNAAYGTLLQGIGQANQAYQTALSTNKSSFQDFLLKMAGLKNDAEATKTNSIISQQNADAQAAAQAARDAESIREYNQNYGLSQQKLSNTGGGSSGTNLTNTPTYGIADQVNAENAAGLYGGHSTTTPAWVKTAQTDLNTRYVPRSALK